METTQQLGGNIELKGFNALDGGTMTIVRKIVGNFARKLSDGKPGFEKLLISLEEDGMVKAEVMISGTTHVGESKNDNLFFALNEATTQAEAKIA